MSNNKQMVEQEICISNSQVECKFEDEENGYYLHYQKKITGSVEFGSQKNLKGVSVKILFIWVGISEVFNNGDGNLEFFFLLLLVLFLLLFLYLIFVSKFCTIFLHFREEKEGNLC
ncbi:hypothetical protein MKX03_028173 [Papaver bracteatum]|nr:hypothetical protein MKX03_028173 [Papaver bracteatum]